jgi:hypothetical protein
MLPPRRRSVLAPGAAAPSLLSCRSCFHLPPPTSTYLHLPRPTWSIACSTTISVWWLDACMLWRHGHRLALVYASPCSSLF